MAKGKLPPVVLEPLDDRLAKEKLANAYEFIIPTINWQIGQSATILKAEKGNLNKEITDENYGDLYEGIL